MKKLSTVAVLFSAVLILLSSCNSNEKKLVVKNIKADELIKLTNKENSPAATIKIDYDYIADAKPNSVEETINKALLKETFGKIVEKTPEATISAYIDNYAKEYKAGLQFLVDEGEENSPILNYEDITSLKHLSTTKNSIVFAYDQYIYTGGAHGMQTIAYHTYNLNTGKEVQLKDIFVAGFEDQLKEIIFEGFKAQSFPGENETSIDGGFFNLEEDLNLDNTFLFTKNGIIFQYQAYAIAPYAAGRPSVEIPYAKLNKILNKENPVVKDNN